VPTSTELDTERASWTQQNYNGAFASPLKLTAGGYRHSSDASLYSVGSDSFYWSSSVSGSVSYYLVFNSSDAGMSMSSGSRAHGFSVRCLKD